MLRLIAFLVGIALIAAGLAWLADRPGELTVQWQGYQIETSVFRAIVILVALVALALVTWSIVRNIWHSPAHVGGVLSRRRQKLGIEALSSGMIALGAGDKSAAMRAAIQARKSLPNEPLTHLLRAQAAQLSGDRTTARRIFEAMLASPDTEQLGLRGLFLEAQREHETEAARHFAERAVALNAKLPWAIDALFDLQCREGDWAGALETLAAERKNGHVDRLQADRRRAVLLTAQAQAIEESDPRARAQSRARGARPGAEPRSSGGNCRPRAGFAREYAARRQDPATHVEPLPAPRPCHRLCLRAHRRQSARPASTACASSRRSAPTRSKAGGGGNRRHRSAPVRRSRAALEPLIPSRMTQHVATLMARIEGEQHADKGRVREWLARAVNAPRDPAWTADGFVADRWMPVSPVTGALDAFQWRVPVEAVEKTDGDVLTNKIEELVALGRARPGDGPGDGPTPTMRGVDEVSAPAATVVRPGGKAAAPASEAARAPRRRAARPRTAQAGDDRSRRKLRDGKADSHRIGAEHGRDRRRRRQSPARPQRRGSDHREPGQSRSGGRTGICSARARRPGPRGHRAGGRVASPAPAARLNSVIDGDLSTAFVLLPLTPWRRERSFRAPARVSPPAERETSDVAQSLGDGDPCCVLRGELCCLRRHHRG
ncbi:MAG: heme biosynthesis HemY N-terminal domain-containing protein [Hyphomicrobium sp.]